MGTLGKVAAVVAINTVMGAPALATEEASPQMSPVVVTATQREQAIRDVPAAASVVTREQIEASGAENVLDAVRDTTGVGLIGQSVGGRKTLSLRGMDGKHTLFLVNGLRVIATDDWVGHSDYQYDWTPVDGVERVEVIRGPMSVLYGSDALGGVVNVITQRPGADWKGRVRIGGRWADGAGGGDATTGGFNVSGGVGEQLRIAVSGSKLHKSPLDLEEDQRVSEVEGKDVQTGHVLLSWQPVAAHTIDFEHRVGDEQRWRDQLSRASRTTPSVLYRDRYDIERSQSVASWRGDWGAAQTSLRVWESDFEVSNKRTQGVTATRPQSMNERAVDGRVALGAGAAQFLTLGFDVRTETMKNAGLANGKGDATHKAVYVQDEVTLADNVLLTLGVRHDRHSVFGGETSPRAYLVWHLDPRWSVRGGYGEGFRAPTLKQISPSYEAHEGPHSFYGNADIKPETSKSFELGVLYAGESFDWEATAFRNDVSDLITTRKLRTDPPPAPGAPGRTHYLYDNVNAARIQGLEAAATWRLPLGFYLGANAQWLDTEDKSTGKSLNGRPDQIINARAGWKRGAWEVVLRAEHVGRQRLSDERVPGYNLAHVSLGYDINRHFRLSAGVDNLTNVRLADKSEHFNYSESPRTVRVALQGSF